MEGEEEYHLLFGLFLLPFIFLFRDHLPNKVSLCAFFSGLFSYRIRKGRDDPPTSFCSGEKKGFEEVATVDKGNEKLSGVFLFY